MGVVKRTNQKIQTAEFTLKKGEFFAVYMAVRGVVPAAENMPALWLSFSGKNFRYLKAIADEREEIMSKMEEFEHEGKAEQLRRAELYSNAKGEDETISGVDAKEIDGILKAEFSDLYDAQESVNKALREWADEKLTLSLAQLPAGFSMDLKMAEGQNKQVFVQHCHWIEYLRAEDED